MAKHNITYEWNLNAFEQDEWKNPKEMKIYWVELCRYKSKKKSAQLALLLHVTDKYVKLVELKRGKLNHQPVKRIKRQNILIVGLPQENYKYSMNDFLTCNSEVIRRHAAEHQRRQDGQD